MLAANRSGNKEASHWHRWLDRYIGIPITALAHLVRAKRTLPVQIRRIALIKGDGMGDLVMLTGPLQDLRQAFPSAQISLWAGRSVAPLARELTSLDEVHLVDFKRPWRVVWKLRAWRADVVIDTGQWSRAEALLTGLSGAHFAIGFQTAGQHRHWLYDARVAHRSDRHELENFRGLLGPLGVRSTSMPHLMMGSSVEQIAISTPYIVFHMWPSGVKYAHLKRWPERYWASLSEACIERGRRVVITGARQDVDLSNRWMARFGDANWSENRTGVSIRETIFVLQNAEAVVSVNTGIVHLAACLGVPTIDLHGPTNAERCQAIGQRVIALQVPPPDGAYLHLGSEYPVDANSRKGLETIEVYDVLQALIRLLPGFQATEQSEILEALEV